MTPIYNEYIQYLRDTTGEPLEFLTEGKFWQNKQVIKCFDTNGNIHKICRIKVDDTMKPKFHQSHMY